MFAWIQIIAGLLFLFGGGEALVRGGVGIAKRLRIPSIIIGMTIVAYGTSAPEMVVSVGSALSGHPDIALGNVIGSNISNVLLVMGLAALIFPMRASKEILHKEGTLLICITMLLVLFCLTGSLTRVHGGTFLMIFVGYTAMLIITTSRDAPPTEEELEQDRNPQGISMAKSLGCLAAGIIALVIGSNILIEGSVSMAQAFGISEAVIGVTIVAVGSSAPELVTSLVASFRRQHDIGIGNIVGSNLVNIMGILGVTASTAPFKVDEKFIEFDIWVLLMTTIFFLVAIGTGERISRFEGLLFFIWYIAYIMYQLS